MGPQFHETGYGRRFFEAQLPALIVALRDVAKELKRANDLKEGKTNEEEVSSDRDS